MGHDVADFTLGRCEPDGERIPLDARLTSGSQDAR